MGNKSLDTLSLRVLRFCLQLMRFLYTIQYAPGKEFYTPDTLSRVLLPEQGDILQSNTLKETELFVETVIKSLPAHKERLNEYYQNQAKDAICSQLITFCRSGWPSQKPKRPLCKYWQFQGQISINDHLILYGSRIVVYDTMRTKTLEKIHRGHQGILKCQL